MGLSDWWYYTGSTTKALVIIGIVAIALLAVILASPYVKPLQVITTRLGLVQEKVVYVPVPVNHTVYVNRTIVKYVNVTVPVYINRTVIKYVPMPVNQTTFVVSPSNQSLMLFWWNVTGYIMGSGWVWGRVVVLPNGTGWFIAVWVVPDSIAGELGLTSCSAGCSANWTTPYGVEYERGWGINMNLLVNGTTRLISLGGLGYSFVSNYTLNYPLPGYTVFIFGDTPGYGPIAFTRFDELVLNGNGTITIRTPLGNATLALNSTYYGYTEYYYPPYYVVVPVRLDIIYAPNPQAALGIPVPFTTYLGAVDTYMRYGTTWNPSWTPYVETYAWWLYRYEVNPINVTIS